MCLKRKFKVHIDGHYRCSVCGEIMTTFVGFIIKCENSGCKMYKQEFEQPFTYVNKK